MEEVLSKEVQTDGAGTGSTREKPSVRKRFSAKRLALMAVFVALSYAVSFLEIPLPLFGASFLKLDFGNVFIILIAFALGPVEGVVVCLLKESLRCLSSSSLCAGELANFIVTSAYLLLPALLYQYKRNLKTVVISLSVSCLIATLVALVANRFIVFPTFAYLFGGSIFGMTVTEAFSAFWLAVLLFNLIKTVSVGILTMLLYKRLSKFLKKMKI
ncbi:MAG: ECF transporter S component [Clostridia bacterium]|nr:ECF transporter S component [Clostridia bacterium]